jgi:glycosyltransferase involved in cell wall biosynthesis
MNKNIAILSTTYLPVQGGIQYLLLWLLKELDNNYYEYKKKYNFDNIYFIIPNYENSTFDKFKNIKVLYIDESMNKQTLLKNTFIIRKYIKNYNISLIHAHNALFDGILCYLSTLYNKCNYIITSHGVDFAYSKELDYGFRLSKFRENIIKIVSSNAIKITSVSNDMLNFIAEISDKKKTVLIENCYDCNKVIYSEENVTKEENKIKSKYKIESNDIIYLTLSGARKIKGHENMIKAFSKIKNKLSNTKIFIAAHGEESIYLKKLVQELKLDNNIYFIGFVTDIKKEAFFNISDVYINTAFFEPFGLVYLEAIESNLSVFGSIQGGGKDIFIHKTNAYLCDPYNIKTMEDGFIFYNDKTNIEKMMNNSKKLLSKYTVENILSKYLTLYDDSINE